MALSARSVANRRSLAGAIGAGILIPGGARPPRLPGNNRVYALGDSRWFDNFRSGAITTEGPMTWARQILAAQGKAIDFTKARNNGVSGATAAEIRANQYAAAKASDAKILVLLSGVNSANTNAAPADVVADNTFMAVDFAASAPDRVALVLDEVPVAGLSNPATQLAVRNGMRALHNPANGINVVPSWDAIATVPDGATPQSWAYRDGIHWGKRGAQAVGKAIAAALAPRLPTLDLFGRPGILVGPANFADFVKPTITGVTITEETVDGVVWMKVAIDNVASAAIPIYLNVGSTLPPGVVAGSSVFDIVSRYRIDAGSQNLRFVNFYAAKQSNVALLATTGESGSDGNDAGSSTAAASGPLSPDAYDGVLQPPPIAFDATATQLRPFFFNIGGLASQPASGVVRFARPQMRLAA